MPGKFYEDFVVGEVLRHQPGRTITESDNVLFTCLTMNPSSTHLDEQWMTGSEFRHRLVNSTLTLAVVVGLSVGDTILGTSIANLGFKEVEFPAPVFHGDTISAETRVLDKRHSRSRPDAGVVVFEHRGLNQRGALVCRCQRANLMRKRALPS
jgi:acyl dehydratase